MSSPSLAFSVTNASCDPEGKAQAIYILTKYNGSRFEFIFTSLVRNAAMDVVAGRMSPGGLSAAMPCHQGLVEGHRCAVCLSRSPSGTADAPASLGPVEL